MKHTAFAAFLGVMLQVTAAFAQGQGGGSPVYQNWFPVGTPATLSVSNVTANVALPTGGLTARVCNTGATDAYVVLGTANTVVATTSAGSFLASGKCQPFNLLPFATRYTYIAAITASSTTTIRVESGLGSPIASDAAGASAHPSGPAGGDLAGTYPNPTVAQATNGFTVPSSGVSGFALCNTADCATNYERLRSFWSGNIATINTEAGGTGVLRGLSINGTTLRPSASTSGRIDFAGGGSSTSSIDARWASTLTASSGTQTVLAVQEVISQSGSAGYTGLLLNPTESGTGSGSKFLIEGKIGAGSDVFTVDDTGALSTNAIKDVSLTSRLTWSATNPTVIRDQNAAAVVSIGSAAVAIAGCAPGTDVLCVAGKQTNTLTTSQMRLAYDGSNYMDFTVGSTGGLTVSGGGGGSGSVVASGGTLAGGLSIGYYNGSVIALPSTGIVAFTSGAVNGTKDTGLSRDSVLGALNLDLGNGSANDKTGILNLAKVVPGNGAVNAPSVTFGTDSTSGFYRSALNAVSFSNAGGEAVRFDNNGVTSIGGTNVTSSNALIVSSNTGQIRFGASADLLLSRPAAATLQLGAADGASPVAQAISFQNVVAGTSNTAGPNASLNGPQSTGTAGGGSVLIKTASADSNHTVNTFTGSASPYTIGFTAGSITTYPIGTVMTVSGCTTATLNGTYTVTASSSGSVTATTSATGTGSPTTCLIVGNTSQNPEVTALTIDSNQLATFAGTITTASNINVASTGTFKFGSRSTVQSPADGNILFQNNAGTSFGRLQLGGTTSSFAAIKLNSTAINFRLADDSADAPITAAAITGSGTVQGANLTSVASITAGSTGNVLWSSRALLNSPADGTVSAFFNDGSTYGALKFATLVTAGSAPTGSGTCTRGAQTGGQTAGTIVLTCTAQTLILTFTTTAPTGWMCEAIDQTTTADTMKQTANSTTTCTLTGTTAASDVVLFQARAY